MAFGVAEKYKRLAGAIYVGDRNTTTGGVASTGLRFIGDASELSLEPTQEFVEHSEHQTGIGFKDLKIPRMTQLTGSITLDNTGIENFKDFLRGTSTSAAGATVTSEAYTTPAAGRSFLLNAPVVTSVTSITATPTPVAGTDYRVDGRVIYLPVGSNIASKSVTITYVSGTSTKVELFASTFKEVYLFFQGLNTVDQKRVTVDLYRVSFDPATLGNLLGDEVLTMTLGFEAIYEPLKASTTSYLGGFGNIAEQD